MASGTTSTTLLRDTRLRILMLSKLPFTDEMHLDGVERRVVVRVGGRFGVLSASYSRSKMAFNSAACQAIVGQRAQWR
jgi:hypothetical protein